MGLCVSKPRDFAALVMGPGGEPGFDRYLHNVQPGEDVEPRLDKVTRKLLRQLSNGGPTFVGDPPVRNLRGSFRE